MFDISPRVKDTVVCIGSVVMASVFVCLGNDELAGVCMGVFGAYALKNGYKSVNGKS